MVGEAVTGPLETVTRPLQPSVPASLGRLGERVGGAQGGGAQISHPDAGPMSDPEGSSHEVGSEAGPFGLREEPEAGPSMPDASEGGFNGEGNGSNDEEAWDPFRTPPHLPVSDQIGALAREGETLPNPKP